ncbi:MAG TPA: prolipoprotein diacylglyceryl transferase, partial [Herpetosiphonaceae bacterium]
MKPPWGPHLLELGPLIIRMYAICILGGAMVAAWLGSYRARSRGYAPHIAWDGLTLGLILGVAGARIWYVASSWPRYRDASWLTIINPANKGMAIHGAIVGAALTVLICARRWKLNVLDWMDILAPALSVGQAIGRWGNFFNQEAYGRQATNGLPWNLDIAAENRIGDTAKLDAAARFHPTFLYESLWNLGVLWAIIAVERRWGRRLRRGDSFLIYGAMYSIGRFWIEDLRVDKLCTSGVGSGSCGDSLSTARLTSIILIAVCGALFAGRRLIRRDPPPSAFQPLDRPWRPADQQAAARPLPARE